MSIELAVKTLRRDLRRRPWIDDEGLEDQLHAVDLVFWDLLHRIIERK